MRRDAHEYGDRFVFVLRTRRQEEEKMSRVYNFSAGPAVLPEEVLREAAEEMMDYKGSGMSVMEMSHTLRQCRALP